MSKRRRSLKRCVIVGTAIVVPTGTANAQDRTTAPIQFGGDPAHTGVYETRGLDGYGGMLWRTELPGPVRSAAAVAGNRVLVGSSGGFLHALDRWTGRELWRYRADGPVHGSPAVWDGRVFVTDGAGTLHAVDLESGEALWRLETGPTLPWPWGHESGDIYLSSPLLGDVGEGIRLWFGAGDGRLRAVDPADGTELWRLETDGRIRSTPALAGGAVVVGSADGRVYAADASTGGLRWRFDTGGTELFSGDFGFDRRTVQSTPAIAEGRVYIGSRKGSLYAIDLESGEGMWESSHGSSWVNGSPAVAGGLVFVGSSDARFIQAVDSRTGEERWRRETTGVVWSSPIIVGTSVIFSESSGLLRAFDLESGETEWFTYLPDATWASPVVDDGTLFIGSDDGFFALRSARGRPFHRAVFWDSTYTEARWYLDHEWLAEGLERRQWERLDAGALERWLAAREADGEPGALVMAIDRLPDRLREGGANSPFRRYLDGGGTVVWPSLLPGLWPRDLEDGSNGGLIAVRWDETSDLLGVDVGAAMFDFMGAEATPAGRALGLPERSLAHWTVDPQPGLEPLAIDENGRYAAWRKGYGGAPGTGFVRIWTSRDPLRDLTPFITAAELRPFDPESDSAPEDVRIGGILDRFVTDGMPRLSVPGLAVSAVRPTPARRDEHGVQVERGSVSRKPGRR